MFSKNGEVEKLTFLRFAHFCAVISKDEKTNGFKFLFLTFKIMPGCVFKIKLVVGKQIRLYSNS